MVKTPYRLDVSWKLEAPIEQVWSVIRAWEQWSDWWDMVEELSIIPGEDTSGIGTLMQTKVKTPLPIPILSNAHITQLQPPHLLEYVSEDTIVCITQWNLVTADWGTLIKIKWEIIKMNPIARGLLRPFPEALLKEIVFNALQSGAKGLASFLDVDCQEVEIEEQQEDKKTF
jgi:hypothetical protein